MEKEQHKKMFFLLLQRMKSYSGRTKQSPVNAVLTSPCGQPVPPCAAAAVYHTAVYTPADLKSSLPSHTPRRQVRTFYVSDRS